MDFFHDFWHADCVRNYSQAAFTERFRKWCKCHGYNFKQSTAQKVYDLAKSVVVLVPDLIKVLVQKAASQVTATSKSAGIY